MKQIERNPDVDLDTQEIPDGMQLVIGKRLMDTARSQKIPFGVASRVNKEKSDTRPETIGLIIRDADVERFNAAIEKKLTRKLKENRA